MTAFSEIADESTTDDIELRLIRVVKQMVVKQDIRPTVLVHMNHSDLTIVKPI